MSKAAAAAAELLLSLGWEAAGETPREHVLMPSKATHWCSGRLMGGEPRTFGGRARFHLPGTDRWATVGRNTTNLYTRGPKGPEGFQRFTSSDLDGIRAAAQQKGSI